MCGIFLRKRLLACQATKKQQTLGNWMEDHRIIFERWKIMLNKSLVRPRRRWTDHMRENI